MNALNNLLDKALEQCSPSNGEELGRRMGVSRSAVSKWRKGGKIDAEHLTALVTIAKVEPAAALLVLQEQAATRQGRAVWGGLLQRFAAAGMHIMLRLGLSRRSRPPAQAGTPPE